MEILENNGVSYFRGFLFEIVLIGSTRGPAPNVLGASLFVKVRTLGGHRVAFNSATHNAPRGTFGADRWPTQTQVSAAAHP